MDNYDNFVENMILGIPSKERFALAMAEEVGELCGKLKRVMRGDDTLPRDELLELGDILFYVVAYAHECGSCLDELILINTNKLTKRKEKGTIRGKGDQR